VISQRAFQNYGKQAANGRRRISSDWYSYLGRSSKSTLKIDHCAERMMNLAAEIAKGGTV
ncbi:MAG: hypothetical protein ABSF72_11035, partial [Candidatus Sulfotelmatobacter sp.]